MQVNSYYPHSNLCLFAVSWSMSIICKYPFFSQTLANLVFSLVPFCWANSYQCLVVDNTGTPASAHLAIQVWDCPHSEVSGSKGRGVLKLGSCWQIAVHRSFAS